jgi:hypothetical protein
MEISNKTRPRGAGRMRRIIAILLTTTAVIASLFVAASPAQADGLACQGTRLGLLCSRWAGSGTTVKSIRASLVVKSLWKCNTEFNVQGTLEGGNHYDVVGVSKCGTGTVWYDFGINRRFQNGTQVCVRYKENVGGSNPWEPYWACFQVWYS